MGGSAGTGCGTGCGGEEGGTGWEWEKWGRLPSENEWRWCVGSGSGRLICRGCNAVDVAPEDLCAVGSGSRGSLVPPVLLLPPVFPGVSATVDRGVDIVDNTVGVLGLLLALALAGFESEYTLLSCNANDRDSECTAKVPSSASESPDVLEK